jgi:hypothetical protein
LETEQSVGKGENYSGGKWIVLSRQKGKEVEKLTAFG